MRVELSEEFYKNFNRKAFFTEKWKKRRNPNALGSLLVVTGSLRRSIQCAETPDGVRFTSNQPYATLHNEGGKITVTAKMKRFFWYKYKQTKDEAWKRMALMKVGNVIIMPQRQFVGDGKDTRRLIQGVIDDNVQRYNEELIKTLKK